MSTLRHARAKWGIPDWMRAEAYPNLRQTTDREWTWEFLRRRPDYRSDWERRKIEAVTVSAGETLSAVTYARPDDPATTYLRYGVSLIYDPRVPMTDEHLWTVTFFEMVTDRVLDDPFNLDSVFGSEVTLEAYERLRKKAEIKRAGGRINYPFNLSLPVEPQIRAARIDLRARQDPTWGKKPTPRPRRDNWPLFLRSLDARDCDATYALISATLWPRAQKTEQSARDTYKRAIELRDSSRINSEHF